MSQKPGYHSRSHQSPYPRHSPSPISTANESQPHEPRFEDETRREQRKRSCRRRRDSSDDSNEAKYSTKSYQTYDIRFEAAKKMRKKSPSPPTRENVSRNTGPSRRPPSAMRNSSPIGPWYSNSKNDGKNKMEFPNYTNARPAREKAPSSHPPYTYTFVQERPPPGTQMPVPQLLAGVPQGSFIPPTPGPFPFPPHIYSMHPNHAAPFVPNTNSYSSPYHPAANLPPKTLPSINNSYPYQFPFPFPPQMSHPFYPYMPQQYNPPNPFSMPPFPYPFYSRSQGSFQGYPQFTNPPPEAQRSRPVDYSADQSPRRSSRSRWSMRQSPPPPPPPTRSESVHAHGDVAPTKRHLISTQEMRRRARHEDSHPTRDGFKTKSPDNMISLTSSLTSDSERPRPTAQVSRSFSTLPPRGVSPSRRSPIPESTTTTSKPSPPARRLLGRQSASLGPQHRTESTPCGQMERDEKTTPFARSTRKLHGDNAPLPPPRDPDYWKEFEEEEEPPRKQRTSEERVAQRARQKSDATLKLQSSEAKANKYDAAERPLCQSPHTSNTHLRRGSSYTKVPLRASNSQMDLDYDNAFPEKEHPDKKEPQTPNTVILEKPRFSSPLSEVPERLHSWTKSKERDSACGDSQVERETRRRRSRAPSNHQEDHQATCPPHHVHHTHHSPSTQQWNGTSTAGGHNDQWPRQKRTSTHDPPQKLPPNVECNKKAHGGQRQQQRPTGRYGPSPIPRTPSANQIPLNCLPPQPQGGVSWKQHANAYQPYSNINGQVWPQYAGQPFNYPQPLFEVPSQPPFNYSVGAKASAESPQRESKRLASPPMRDETSHRHQNNARHFQPSHPIGSTPPLLRHRLSDTRSKLAHLLHSSLPSLEEAPSSTSNPAQSEKKDLPASTRQARSSAMKSMRSRNRTVINPTAGGTKTSRATSLPSTPTSRTAVSRPSSRPSLSESVSSARSRPSTPTTLSSVSALTLTVSRSVARPPRRVTPRSPSISAKCQRKESSCCSSQDEGTPSVVVTSQTEEKEVRELSVSETVIPTNVQSVPPPSRSMSGVHQVTLRIVRDQKIVSKYTVPANAILKKTSDVNDASQFKKNINSSKNNEKMNEFISGSKKRKIRKGSKVIGKEKRCEEFTTMNTVSRTIYSSSWSTSYEVHTSESTVPDSCYSEIGKECAPAQKRSQHLSVTQNREHHTDRSQTLTPNNGEQLNVPSPDNHNGGVSSQAIGDKKMCDLEGKKSGIKSEKNSIDNVNSEELKRVQKICKKSGNANKDGAGKSKRCEEKVKRDKRRIKRHKRKQSKSDDPESHTTEEKQLEVYYGEDASGSRKSSRKTLATCHVTQRRLGHLRRRRCLQLMCLCKLPRLCTKTLYMNTRTGRWDPAGMRFLIDEPQTKTVSGGVPPSDPTPRIPTPPREPLPSATTTQPNSPTEDTRIPSAAKSGKIPRSSLTWVSPPAGFSKDFTYGQRIEEILPSCLIVTGLSENHEETVQMKTHFFAIPAVPHSMLGGRIRPPKFPRVKWCVI